MKDFLLQLLDYERWANERVIYSLHSISQPPERAIAVMGHILSAQEVWFNRITGAGMPVAVWQSVPVHKLAEKAEHQYRLLKAFLTEASDQTLANEITYQNSKGETFRNTLQDILTHLSHHAAYHRGQVVQLISPHLDQAPVTDYIFWIRNS